MNYNINLSTPSIFSIDILDMVIRSAPSIVYRLIGNISMIPSYFKIEIFAQKKLVCDAGC